jgi:hypothetical protein
MTMKLIANRHPLTIISDATLSYKLNHIAPTNEINQNWESVINLEIFPNPVKDELFLKIKPIPGKASISITTVEGVKIKEQKLSENTTVIDARDFPQGIYFF